MKNIFRIEIDPSRVFGLDILRALAILFVVVQHGRILLFGKLTYITGLFVFDGVTIFFVLSGFLIGGILIRTIEKNGISKSIIFNFWIRRWFRTLPNYFLILLILCFLQLFFTDHFTFRSVKEYFFFSQNFFTVHPPWFFPEAWSLSVEEWFYFIVPILLGLFTWLLKKKPRQIVLLTSVIVIILVTFVRFYRYSTISIDTYREWDSIFRKQVITRLDSLMIGVIGAYIQFYNRKLWLKYKNPLLIFGIALFILTKFVIDKQTQINGLYSTVFSFSIISIATLSLLPYLSVLKTGKGVFYTSITYLSLASYSIYLLHVAIIQNWILIKIRWRVITDNEYLIAVLQYGLYWVLLILMSIILYKYFEIPMTKLRDNKKFKKMGLTRVFHQAG